MKRNHRSAILLGIAVVVSAVAWATHYIAGSYPTPKPAPASAELSAQALYSAPTAAPSAGSAAPQTSPPVAENGTYYGQPNDSGTPKTVHVEGYYRKDGTYVRGHYRSKPKR